MIKPFFRTIALLLALSTTLPPAEAFEPAEIQCEVEYPWYSVYTLYRLTDLIREGTYPRSHCAAEALRQYFPRESTPLLVRLLKDENPAARETAARALGDYDASPQYRARVRPALLRALQDPKPEVRRAALDALEQMRDYSDDVVRALLKISQHDPHLNETALYQLSEAPMLPAWAGPTLKQLLQNAQAHNGEVEVLRTVLRKVGTADALEIVANKRLGPDEAEVLRRIAPTAVPALATAAAQAAPENKPPYLIALALIDTPKARKALHAQLGPLLRTCLQELDSDVFEMRYRSGKILIDLHQLAKPALPRLLPYLQTGDFSTFFDVIRIFNNIGQPEHIPALRAAAPRFPTESKAPEIAILNIQRRVSQPSEAPHYPP